MNSWLLFLDSVDKHDLKSSHLGSLLSLCQVKISWDLLRAVATFWNPELHLLHFGNHELCPLVEEFRVVLSFPLYCLPALPATFSNLSALYHYSLGLDDESVTTILFGEEVGFVALISYLQKIGRAINNDFGCEATIPCLLSVSLFIGRSSNRGPAALLSVVEEQITTEPLCVSLLLRLSYVWTLSLIHI